MGSTTGWVLNFIFTIQHLDFLSHRCRTDRHVLRARKVRYGGGRNWFFSHRTGPFILPWYAVDGILFGINGLFPFDRDSLCHFPMGKRMVASDSPMRLRLHMWDGGSEGADHTLLPMTGGDRWSRPKSHSFGSTQSYFPVIPVGAETIGITVRPWPPPVPPLLPPHNHWWGFTRTGRSGPNRCAQGENVALFVYPPRIGRTDRSDAQTVSGPIIRTIARPHPLPVPPLFPPSCLLWGWAGTGRCRPKPLCAKGKGYPFALFPSHWSYRSLRCVRGTKFSPRTGRATCSDARAVLSRHPLISTRRAPCAARRALLWES